MRDPRPVGPDAGEPAARRAVGSSRQDTAARLRVLVDGKGLSIAAAARTLGISRSWASEALRDPTGDRARERKARHLAACPVCDEPMTGRRTCLAHSGDAARVHTRETVDAALRAWHAEHGWIPSSTDLNPTHARRAGEDALARQRAAGISAETVRRVHGTSYAEALRAVFGPGTRPGRLPQ